MHLINGDRLVESILAVVRLHPAGVGPVESVQMTDHGTGVRTNLVLEAVGIGLLIAVTVLGANLVFVEMAFWQARDEQFPDAADALLHRMLTSIP